nr:DUF4347 domain-containing protein [uncultured Cohaesibacter sp.]
MGKEIKKSVSISNDLQDRKPSGSLFAFRELEPRIAFDGALLATALDELQSDDLLTSDNSEFGDGTSGLTDYDHASFDLGHSDAGDNSDVASFEAAHVLDTSTSSAANSATEIIFVIDDVVDADQLLADLDPVYEVVFLDADQDGLLQMADYLAGRSDIGALHIISHGDEGSLELGSATLTFESMSSTYADELKVIGEALSEQADILVYGCNFGSGAVGTQAALQLSILTGADVAASDDLTGHSDQGGDWDLELETGAIESDVAIGDQTQANWAHVLADPLDIIALPGVATSDIHSAYSFEVSSILGLDDSGNGQHMAMFNSPDQTVSADGSSALDLDSGDYAELPSFESGGAMTIAASVRFDTVGSYQRVFDFGQTDATGLGNIYVARSGTSSDLTFAMTLQGSYTNQIFATGVITDAEWLHFVATVDEDGLMTLYVNGVEAASFSGTALSTGTRDNYYIGKSNFTGDADFDGAIDNFIVLNEAVSAEQAAALYNQSGFAIDENSINGTVVGTVYGTDSDSGESLSYSLADDVGGRFAINSSTGEITVADSSLLDYETATSHDLTVRVTDGTSGTRDEILTVNLNNQDFEPQQVVPVGQSVTENGSLTFSSGNGNAITVSDSSAADTLLSVTLDASNGQMSLAQLTGITITAGSDDSDYLVIQGLESDLNAALDGLVFVPDEDFNGIADITVTTSLSVDLAADYTFDAGSAANDSPTLGGDGVFSGEAGTAVDAERGTVLSLDGNGDYITIDGVFDQPDQVTLAAWVNFSSIDTGGAHVISLGDSVVLAVDITGFGYGVSGLIYNGTSWDILASGQYIQSTGWHHVAYTYDDANDIHTLYLDGEIVATSAIANSISYSLAADTVIGTHGDGNVDYEYNGLIDDARIYTRALSPDEIAAVASSKDIVSNSISITVDAVNNAPEFGTGSGLNIVSLADLDDEIVDFEILSDGSIIALSAVNTASSGQDIDFGLTKYLSDGTIDTSWGTNGSVITAINTNDETVSAMTVQSDGKIMVSGSYNNGSSDHGVLIRYNADGSLDSSFGSGGILGVGSALGDNDYGRDILVQPDGKILATGDVAVGGVNSIYITRHNEDGSLDTSFGGSGIVSLDIDVYDEFVTTMLLQSDGKIIVGGYNDTYASMDFALIRLNSDGSYDSGFDGDGIWTNYDVSSDQISYATALDASDRILIAGTTNTAGNLDSFVMRVNSDGSLDTSFGSFGSVTLALGSSDEKITQIRELSDGKILLAGFAYNGADNDLLLVRLNADGSLDARFGSSGYLITDLGGSDDRINALAILDTGEIVVGGKSDSDGFLARFDSDGAFDRSFNITGLLDGTPSYVEDGSAVVLDGDVLVFDVELSGLDSFDGASIQIQRQGGADGDDSFVESGTLGSLTEGGALSVDSISVGTVTTNSSGTLLLTFNANATNVLVNHVLQQIAYYNISSAPPSSVTLSWTFFDGNSGAQGSGGSKSATGSTVVSITAVNSAPLNNVPGPQAVAQDASLTFSAVTDNEITISDGDAGASVVEVSLTAVDGTISLGSLSGLSFSSGDGTDDNAMTFQGTISDINTALEGLVFTPTPGFSGFASLGILTSDLGNSGSGGAQTDSDLIEIDVGIAQFQEGIDSYVGTIDTYADASQPATVQGVLHYISVNETGGSDTGLLLFDNLFGNGAGQVPAGATINDVSLWIYVLSTDSATQVTVHEMLSSWDETSTYNSLVDGVAADDVEASSTVLATIDAGVEGWIKIDGLVDLVQSWADGGTNHGLAFVSQGADNWMFASSEYGTLSMRPHLAIDYTVSSAPVITPSGSSATFTEGGTDAVLDPALSLSYADSTNLTGATLQITNCVTGQDALSFTNQNGISGSWDAGTGTLTLSGSASLAQYETAIQSITYSNSSDDPDVTTRSIDLIVSNGGVNSDVTTLSVNVAAVNDIAYNAGSLPSDLSVTEDLASDLDLSAVNLADLDDRGGAITLSLSTSSGGQLTLATASGITVTGNGTGAATITGTLADLNSYLDTSSNIKYQHPTGNLNGDNADVLTLGLDDNGNTGSGSSSASLGTINIDIIAVNDTPTDIAPNGFSIAETTDTTGGYSLGTLTTTDPDSGDSFTYTITGGADAASFSIGGGASNELLLDDGVLDYNAQSSYEVVLRSTDGAGAWIEETLTITVIDQNQAPSDISPNGFSLDEGIDTTGGVTLGTLAAVDPDSGDSFSFALIGGADQGSFSLGGASGNELIFDDGLLNHEAQSSYTVEVQVTDSGGSSYSEFLTVTINDVNDAPTGSVTISGAATEGQTLAADTSTIADEDGLGTFAYQWYRDGAAIVGATGSCYGLGQSDVGSAITVSVSYVDGYGASETLISAATGPIANVNDAVTGSVMISGTATEGQTLAADTSTMADEDGLGAFAYQWYRDGAAIVGATGSCYGLGQSDVGSAITVSVSYVDGYGASESLVSAATGPIANVNDTPTGSVTISGTATEGQTLAADTSTIADEDGLGTFAYQWYRDGAVIVGATGSSYGLGQSDVGFAIKVSVSYVDGYGASESLTSQSIDISASDDNSSSANNQLTPEQQIPEQETTDTVAKEYSGEMPVRTEADQSLVQGSGADIVADQTEDHSASKRDKDKAEQQLEGDDLLAEALDRSSPPVFKEFKRALSARVQYERIGFGHIEASLVSDAVDQSLRDLKQHNRILGATSIDLTMSVGSVLSAGFVTWVIRSGALMSAFLSTMPVWRGFDPLVILGSTGPLAMSHSKADDKEEGELSKAERVFDRFDKKRGSRPS